VRCQATHFTVAVTSRTKSGASEVSRGYYEETAPVEFMLNNGPVSVLASQIHCCRSFSLGDHAFSYARILQVYNITNRPVSGNRGVSKVIGCICKCRPVCLSVL